MFSFSYQNINLLLTFFSIYLLFFILGIFTAHIIPKKLSEFIKKSDEISAKKVREKFEDSSEKIKSGDKKVFLKTALTLWHTNVIAVILMSISSMLFLPLVLNLIYSPFQQGITIRKMRPSSFMSGFYYLCMATMEWITYPVVVFAGVQLSVNLIIFVTRKNIDMFDIIIGYLLFIVCSILLLFIQSFFEIQYVRKVLKKGMTAIPLMPY